MNKIKFKDLSTPLKIAVVAAFLYGVELVVYFLNGFFSA